eukprot:5038194-Amphidinium_carterae.1
MMHKSARSKPVSRSSCPGVSRRTLVGGTCSRETRAGSCRIRPCMGARTAIAWQGSARSRQLGTNASLKSAIESNTLPSTYKFSIVESIHTLFRT